MTHDGKVTILSLDTTVYSRTCILRACYKFTDRAYLFLSRQPDAPHIIVVSIRNKEGTHRSEAIAGDFGNELIDQALREVLDERFGPIRNLIVARALAEGNLLMDVPDGAPDDDGK
jgi:His-Xaa-Ser system protein HxsD